MQITNAERRLATPLAYRALPFLSCRRNWAAHYLKMLMSRMIISKMATKINSMMKKMVTKATRPIMNMLILMIQDQIDGVCFGYAIYGAAFFDFATAYYYLWC